MEKHIIREKVKREEKSSEAVPEGNPLAVHEHKCRKCGYGKAQLIECGIWIADEDCVVKYKCGKCGHVEDASEKPT